MKVSRNRLYYAAFLAYLLQNNLNLLWVEPLLPIVNGIRVILRLFMLGTLAGCLVWDIAKKCRTVEILKVVVVICFSITFIITDESYQLYTAVFVVMATGIVYQEFLDYFFKIEVYSLVGTVLFNIIGLTRVRYVTFTYGEGNCIGMTHPNNFAALALVVGLLVLYKYYNKKKYLVIFACELSAFLLYRLTLSRTACILLAVSPILFVLIDLLQVIKTEKLINLTRFAVFAVFIISLYLMVNGGNLSSITDLNFIYRFTSSQRLFQEYGIKPFGTYIEFVSSVQARLTGQRAVILDTAYLFLLISQGWIATLFYVLFFYKAANKIYKAKEFYLLIILLIFLMYGVMEQFAIRGTHNFILYAAFMMVNPRLIMSSRSKGVEMYD